MDPSAGPNALWAASGAMALTGREDGPPLLAPPGLAAAMHSWAEAFAARTRQLGGRVAVDGPALLGERAAITGGTRHGDRSVGGATRLLPAADGWLSLCLARLDDIAAVPAWLQRDLDADPWTVVAEAVAARPGGALVERGRLLGLPCSELGSVPGDAPPVIAAAMGHDVVAPCASLSGLVVVDLSSLWAGPLCTNLLQQAGARVVKLESRRRPDGARTGSPAFFDLLNGGKESVAVDLDAPGGIAALTRWLERADVVVESSRPRALAQLGIDVAAIAAAGRLRVWLSITAYGRDHPGGDWVGFGDDAAVAGGLVAWDAAGPCFCGDAVADPATGLLGALYVVDHLVAGGRWLLDAALARTAAHLARPPAAPRPWTRPVAAPRARPIIGTGPRLGEHGTEP